MNQELWQKIIVYNLDDPPTEYSFSIRLATENFWTSDFTERAILEYKKFMYLAATSDRMVSPSEVVDAVWHQHLVFTQSYQEFCAMLGKQIQHVPSTHKREEADRFKKARDHTRQLYTENFGTPPYDVWECASMFDSLKLPKAKWKIRSFVIGGILAFAFLIVPFYYLLVPLYRHIPNPEFLFGLMATAIGLFIFLWNFTKREIEQDAWQFKEHTFIQKLAPLELIYLEKQNLFPVVTAVVNDLIKKDVVFINPEKKLEVKRLEQVQSAEQLQVVSELTYWRQSYYSALAPCLMKKPMFQRIERTMDALKKYYSKSTRFVKLFQKNFVVLAFLMMLALIRLITGLEHGMPAGYIFIVVLLLPVAIAFFLYSLTKLMCTHAIPELYRKKLKGTQMEQNDSNWRYFLYGSAALSPSFEPIVVHVEQKSGDSWGFSSDASSDSSCGSSCGSSCSSCGGCGGD